MKKPIRGFLLSGTTLGLLIFGNYSCAAEAQPALTEEAFFAEFPVVLTATRLGQTQSETPAAVTIIDRELIHFSGARKISDLFRLVPGFQMGARDGHQPLVTYHGLGDEFPRRFQVLIDGRSVYGSVFGGVFWSDLSLAIEDIEKIEVIRGPNSATFGSNAFFGIINIITRHASQTPGSALTLAKGNHSVGDGFFRQGWKGKDHNARVSIGYRTDDGFDGQLDTERTTFANLRADIQTSYTDSLELQIGVTSGTREEGEIGIPDDLPRDDERTSHFQQLRWRHAVNVDEEVSTQFFHNYWKKDEDYLTDPLNLGPLGIAQVPVTFDLVTERYDLELQHTLSPMQTWRFVWGAGARLDQVKSRTFFATDNTIKNRIYRLFGSAEWRMSPALLVNVGAMLENTDIVGTDFSPRLALNYHLTPRHTLRVSTSRATRTPSLLEEKGNQQFPFQGVILQQVILANGGLKPERLRSYELGYFYHLPKEDTQLDVRLYEDKVHDLITAINIPFPDLDGRATDFLNEGTVDVTGLELQLMHRPNPDARIVLNYAVTDASVDGVVSDSSNDAYRLERSVPHTTTSLLVAQRFSNSWEASFTFYRVSDIYWLSPGNLVDDYSRVDARVAYGFRIGKSPAEIAFTIQNAGSEYVDFDADNIFDRRAFVTLSLGPH